MVPGEARGDMRSPPGRSRRRALVRRCESRLLALVALWSRLPASSLAKNRESQNKLIEMRQIRGNFRICTREPVFLSLMPL